MGEPFLGEIKMVGFTFAPRGWVNCDGQLLAISSYSALFSLYGTTYGGDGRTTFGIPDLRGRMPMHEGTGPGLPTYQQGSKAGSPTHTLTQQQMPSHTHTAQATKIPGTSINPSGLTWAADSSASDKTYAAANSLVNMAPEAITHTGGGQAFSIQNAYLTVRFVCAVIGLYPSRN